MSKVLRADGAVDNAYVQFDLPGDEAEVWVTFRVAFDAAALAFWVDNSSPDFLDIYSAGLADQLAYVYLFGDPSAWSGPGGSGDTPAPTADVWQLCEMRFVDDGTQEFYVDGDLVFSGPAGTAVAARSFLLGMASGGADVASVLFVDDVKIGTTRGADDLFSDDFESGDLSAWSSEYGDVSVVNDPFDPTPPVYTLELCDRATDELLVDLTAYATFKVSVRENRPTTVTARMASVTPGIGTAHDDGDANLTVGTRALKVRQDGVLVAHVIVWNIAPAGDANTAYIEVTGHDPMMLLRKRPYRDVSGNLIDPEFESPISGAEIVKGGIENSVAFEGDLPIDTTTGDFDTTIPPAEDLGAELTNWPIMLDALISLLVETGAIDIVMRPVDSATHDPGIMAELSVVNDRGTDLTATVNFDYGTGDFNVQTARRSTDYDDLCNKLYYYLGPKVTKTQWRGNITATEMGLEDWETMQLDSRAKYDTSMVIRVYDSNADEVSARPLFTEVWKREVERNVVPEDLLFVTPAANVGPQPFADYNPGDTVALNTSGIIGPAIEDGPQRIQGYDVEVSEDGVGRVSELLVSVDGVGKAPRYPKTPETKVAGLQRKVDKLEKRPQVPAGPFGPVEWEDTGDPGAGIASVPFYACQTTAVTNSIYAGKAPTWASGDEVELGDIDVARTNGSVTLGPGYYLVHLGAYTGQGYGTSATYGEGNAPLIVLGSEFDGVPDPDNFKLAATYYQAYVTGVDESTGLASSGAVGHSVWMTASSFLLFPDGGTFHTSIPFSGSAIYAATLLVLKIASGPGS